MLFGESKFERFIPPRQERREEIEEREKIKLVENSPLNPQDKLGLLLVLLGEKPAASLSIESRFYKTETEKEKEKITRSLAKKKSIFEETLKKLGLPYFIQEYGHEEEKTIFKSFFISVGQDEEKLKSLLNATNHEEVGLALGYPKTAIEAFLQTKEIRFDELRESLSKQELKELQREGVFKFLYFMPSREHWRTEIELFRKAQRLIKEKSPRIYKEIMRESIDPLTLKGSLRRKYERILNRIEYLKRGFREKYF